MLQNNNPFLGGLTSFRVNQYSAAILQMRPLELKLIENLRQNKIQIRFLAQSANGTPNFSILS